MTKQQAENFIENYEAVQTLIRDGYISEDAAYEARALIFNDIIEEIRKIAESEDEEYEKFGSLNEIKEEVKNCIVHSPFFNTTQACCKVRDDVMQIFDKYIRKIEEVE